MSLIVLDYACTGCGHVFESFEARSAPAASLTCPECGAEAERCISAPKIGTVWGAAVSRGGVAEKPSPGALDTRPIADGMPVSEWKRRQRKYRVDQAVAKARRELG